MDNNIPDYNYKLLDLILNHEFIFGSDDLKISSYRCLLRILVREGYECCCDSYLRKFLAEVKNVKFIPTDSDSHNDICVGMYWR